jgi:DNA-binding XRE family transcriptional regulator
MERREVIMKIKLKDVDIFKKMLMISGFSQRGLARTVGISEPYANQIANGERNPGPKIAKMIVDALNCEFDDIFFIDCACNSNQQNYSSQ